MAEDFITLRVDKKVFDKIDECVKPRGINLHRYTLAINEKILQEYLENKEDLQAGEEALARLAKGEAKFTSWKDTLREFTDGLGD
jgi:predicted DNA-binding protein